MLFPTGPPKPESRASFSKLEKQRRDLKEIIVVLRENSDLSPLSEALDRAEGNQSEAARILQVSRDKVSYKIAKHVFKRFDRFSDVRRESSRAGPGLAP